MTITIFILLINEILLSCEALFIRIVKIKLINFSYSQEQVNISDSYITLQLKYSLSTITKMKYSPRRIFML